MPPCNVVISQEANRKPGLGVGDSPIAELTRRRCALPPHGTGECNCHLGAQERVGRTEAPVDIPAENTTGRDLLHRLCEVRFSRDTGEGWQRSPNRGRGGWERDRNQQ